jgi:hypothetical protein
VHRLFLAGHRPGQLPEDALHTVFEEVGCPVVGGLRRRHGVVTWRE